MTFDWLTEALRPPNGSSEGGSSEGGPRGRVRIAAALALGLLVFPIQRFLLVGWRAATDVPVVEALALLSGGSSLGLMLLSGVVTLAAGSSGAEALAERAGELERAAQKRVESRAARPRLDGLRVESGPTYASMGATADNPRPEWGALRWSLRLFADLQVPDSGAYELTVEYRLPDADEWHARIEEELALEEGGNRLEVTLDANDSRSYQGVWALERAGGTLIVVLQRTLAPEEFYGTDPAGMVERARRIFGDAGEALRPTPRTVELLRDRVAL